MKRISLLFVVASLALSLACPVLASDVARTLGMSGAMVAIDDLSAPIYNPALLAKMGKRQVGVSISYVRQTLDTAADDPNFDDIRSDADQIVPLDNLGFVTPFGPGAAYIGFNTEKRFLISIRDNPLVSGDMFGETSMYSPMIAYGMKVSPALSLGAALIYNYKYYSGRLATDTVDVPMWKISRNVGMNLGALYTLNSQIDLGASLSLVGASAVTGYADLGDGGSEDFIIAGNHPNPSTFRLGGAYRPRDNVTLGLEFDIINGFAITEKEDFSGDTEYHYFDATVKADTVIATRLGAEYVLPAKALRLPLEGAVPLRAGVCFIPDNKMVTGLEGDIAVFVAPAVDIASYLDLRTPNTTSFSLGVGYNTSLYELGLSALWITGTGDVLFDDPSAGKITFDSTDQRIVASAKFFI